MHEVIKDIFKEVFDATKREGMQLGRQEGRQEGVHEEKERVASDMLKKNLPLSLIVEISKLSKDSVLNLAKSLGISVM